MKNKVIRLFGCLLLVSSAVLPVSANEMNYDWTVTFDGSNHMNSTFDSTTIQDVIAGMQPGDNTTFNVTLKNTTSNAAEFYLDNQVIRSFEDDTVAEAGGYTYILQYIPNGGAPETIYSSAVVGGESIEASNVGLHEAVNAFANDDSEYVYLENIPANGQGVVRLYVELDGETQNNNYQNTLAQLSLKFAAEIPPTVTVTPDKEEVRIVRHEDRIVYLPNTGDETNLPLYILTFGVSVCLFVFAFMKLRKTTKEN